MINNDLQYTYAKLLDEIQKCSKNSGKNELFNENIKLSRTKFEINIDSNWINKFETHLPYIQSCLDELRVSPKSYETAFIVSLIKKCQKFAEPLFFTIERATSKNFLNITSNYNKNNTSLESNVDEKRSLVYDKSNIEQDIVMGIDMIEKVADIKNLLNIFAKDALVANCVCEEVENPLKKTDTLKQSRSFVKAVELWNYICAYKDEKFTVQESEVPVSVNQDIRNGFYELSNINDFFTRIYADPDYAAKIKSEYLLKKSVADNEKKEYLKNKIDEIKEQYYLVIEKKFNAKILELNRQIDHQKFLAKSYKNSISKSSAQIIDDCDAQIERILRQKDAICNKLKVQYQANINELKANYDKQCLEQSARFSAEKSDLIRLAQQKNIASVSLAEVEQIKHNYLLDIDKLNSDIALLKSRINELQEINAKQEQQINDCQLNFDKELSEQKRLFGENVAVMAMEKEKQLKDENCQKNIQLKKELEEKTAELEKLQKESKQVIQSQADEIIQLKAKIDANTNEQLILQAQSKEFNQSQAEEIEKLKSEASTWEEKYQLLKDEMEDINKSHLDEVAKLKEEIVNKDKESTELEDKLANAQTLQLQETNNLKNELENVMAENKSLKAELNVKTEELQSYLANKAIETENVKDELNKQIEELKSDVENKVSEYNSLQEMFERKSSEYDDLKCEFANQTEAFENLQTEHAQKIDEISALELKLSDKTNEYETLRNEIESKTMQFVDLQTKFDDKVSEFDELQESSQNASNAQNYEIEQLNIKLLAKEQEVEDLTKDIQNLQNNLQQLQNALYVLKSDTSELDKLQDNLRSISLELASVKTEIGDISTEKSTTIVETYSKDIDDDAMKALQEKLDQLRDEVNND